MILAVGDRPMTVTLDDSRAVSEHYPLMINGERFAVGVPVVPADDPINHWKEKREWSVLFSDGILYTFQINVVCLKSGRLINPQRDIGNVELYASVAVIPVGLTVFAVPY